jgi:hypothetical protein
MAPPILITEISDPPVVGVRKGGPPGLAQARDHHQPRFASAGGVDVDHTEQAMLTSVASLAPYLEPARHLSVHGFPVAAAGEPMRWRGGDSDQGCAKVGLDVRIATVEKGPSRRGPIRVVVRMAPEVFDLVFVGPCRAERDPRSVWASHSAAAAPAPFATHCRIVLLYQHHVHVESCETTSRTAAASSGRRRPSCRGGWRCRPGRRPCVRWPGPRRGWWRSPRRRRPVRG